MKASNIDKIARDYIEKSGYGKYFVHIQVMVWV